MQSTIEKMVSLEKAISWQRYKWSKIMKAANESTWLQLLSHVYSFYGVGTVKAGNMMVDNQGLTLPMSLYSNTLLDFGLIKQ